MKLGKLPARHDPRTLRLAKYVNLSRLPAVPAAFDWSMREDVPLQYPMLGNDRFGDCVFASACHLIGTWSGQTGVQQAITEDTALDAYSRFAGFSTSDPTSDNGAVMLDVANRWRNDEIAGQTIKAYAMVDRDNEDLLTAAAWLFGGLWTGWALPQAWQGADEWTAGPGMSGQWEKGSWGGHAVHVPLVSPGMLGVKTWGARMPTTWAALHAYCDEAYAVLSSDLWLRMSSGECPAGLDLDALLADLAIVTVT